MFAIYNGHRYQLIENSNAWELISKKEESLKDDFVEDGNIFRKQIINPEEFSDIFDISFGIQLDAYIGKNGDSWTFDFDSSNPNTTSFLDIPLDEVFILENKVKVVLDNILVPGWHVEEDGVSSSTYVDISQIDHAWIEKHDKDNALRSREKINPESLYDRYIELLEY